MVAGRDEVRLNPDSAFAHGNLANILGDNGQLDEAIACYRKAIELDPRNAAEHGNLAWVHFRKGQLDEAIDCWRKAFELDPKHPQAKLWRSGVDEIGAGRDKLVAFQNGSYTPANNKERLHLADLGTIKKVHHLAAGLYAAAFADDPKLADAIGPGHRYQAACCAALAGVGQGADAAKLDDNERASLREQALDWLRADLALRTKQLETRKPDDRAAVQQALRRWQTDTDLAGLRDGPALAKLPADEQKAFTQLWADVAALLKKGEETPK